ncbi:hypothetical protein E2320_003717 [Naja naja]|nr:hypothetical protein E2320_003717 [Naja naja]
MYLGADIPPPPVLKLDPLSQRVKEGDCMFLLCLAEGSSTEKKFHFYKDGMEITSREEGQSHLLQPIREEEEDDDRDESLVQPGIMSPSRNSTFLPSLFQSFVDPPESRTENLSSGQIKIICTCKIVETSWGQPDSPESNQLVFSVVGVPPSPLLKVDPLSQRVKEGDPLVFLCLMEGGTTKKKFHFYKDGVEITSSKESLLEPSSEPTDPLQNASLRIPHASFNHSGEFACSYEEKRSNRWIKSSLSQGVNITVEPDLIESKPTRTEQTKIFCQEILNHPFCFLLKPVSPQDSDPIWRYYRVAITIIILLVPFAFYCWTKKSKSPPMEQSQLAEKKKERGDLGMMEPPAVTAATASPVKDSEATYSNIQDSFTVSPRPTRENCLTQEKTGGTLYYNLEIQLKK